MTNYTRMLWSRGDLCQCIALM